MLVRFTDKVLGKKFKFKKTIPNPILLLKSPTPFNNNFSNLKDVIELEENCNNIRYFISNNKDNSNNSVNFYNSVTSVANFLIIIFKNYKKTYY